MQSQILSIITQVLSIIGLISTSVGVAEFTSMTEVDGMLKEEVEKLAVTDEGKREAMNDVRVGKL